jgi:hypothetical protein
MFLKYIKNLNKTFFFFLQSNPHKKNCETTLKKCFSNIIKPKIHNVD